MRRRNVDGWSITRNQQFGNRREHERAAFREHEFSSSGEHEFARSGQHGHARCKGHEHADGDRHEHARTDESTDDVGRWHRAADVAAIGARLYCHSPGAARGRHVPDGRNLQ
jgi:hypothetical protein